MPPFDPEEAGKLLALCSQADQTAVERGGSLEDMAAYVFGAIPGVRVRARNALSVLENEELDLLMSNESQREGLPLVDSYFAVECKNWSRPTGSAELSWFATKLRRSGQKFGVLLAAQGITGTNEALRAAHFEVAAALLEGQQVVVLTMDEVARLSTGEQLASLLSEKVARLIARREVYIAPEGEPLVDSVAVPLALRLRTTRDGLLDTLCERWAEGGVKPDALAMALHNYRHALLTFTTSEGDEPSGSDIDSKFDDWLEANAAAFDELEARILELAAVCVAGLRRGREELWARRQIALAMDTRAPRNLDATPDTALSDLLLTHWTEQADYPQSYAQDEAYVCILSLALGWISAVRDGLWPSPWV